MVSPLLSQIPRASIQRHTQVDGKSVVIEEKLSTDGNRYRRALSSVYAGGDYGRLMEGVFENYLDIKFKDMHMENVSFSSLFANLSLCVQRWQIRMVRGCEKFLPAVV